LKVGLVEGRVRGSPAMAAAAADGVSASSDEEDQEIIMMVSMRGRQGSSGMEAITRTPAGDSKVNFKRPLGRSIVEIDLYHSGNGHIGSNMTIKPTTATPEQHGWRIVECQSRAGGTAPPFTNVQCYGLAGKAPALAQDLPLPPYQPCPPPFPTMKRRRRDLSPPAEGAASSGDADTEDEDR